MAAWGYEFYLLMLNLSLVRCAHSWEILSALEDKIGIPARPCNILYISDLSVPLRSLRADVVVVVAVVFSVSLFTLFCGVLKIKSFNLRFGLHNDIHAIYMRLDSWSSIILDKINSIFSSVLWHVHILNVWVCGLGHWFIKQGFTRSL